MNAETQLPAISSGPGIKADQKPTIRIEHKTGAIIAHRLDAYGRKVYADAEEVLAKLPRCGIPTVLRELKDGNAKPFAFSTMQHRLARA